MTERKFPSLFARLVGRFATHPENLATEALQFILESSPAAREGLSQFIGSLGVELAPKLNFRTQEVSGDEGTPDLVGCRADGTLDLVVELKFGAELTGNQPSGYLTLLPKDRTGVLLFVAPKSRESALWAQCVGRLQESGRAELSPKGERVGAFRRARVDSHVMAITSWEPLLTVLERRVSQAEDRNVLSDLHQLQGLVDRMEHEGFLPFRHEDLTPERGRIQYQLVQLVEHVIEELKLSSHVFHVRPRAVGKLGSYHRRLKVHGFDCSIAVSPRLWIREGETPLWLIVRGSRRRLEELSDKRHSNLPGGSPRRAFSFIKEGQGHVPLFIRVGAERTEVVADLVDQVRQVAELLGGDGRV